MLAQVSSIKIKDYKKIKTPLQAEPIVLWGDPY